MTIKCTALFQLATNVSSPLNPARRLAGWSETWYFPGTDVALARFEFSDSRRQGGSWCDRRAAFMPNGSVIVGQRYQVVDPRGPSQSTAVIFPGTYNVEADVPQMALLLRVPGEGVINVRTTILRGLPDDRVREGELFPTVAFNTALRHWLDILPTFRFRGRDLVLPTTKIFTVSSVGLVNTETPHGLLVNDMVRISKCLSVFGNFISGRFQVQTVGPGTNAFTVSTWTGGTATGGSVRKDAIIYPTPRTNIEALGRVVVRKVGRPFTQYRGRRSRRAA